MVLLNTISSGVDTSFSTKLNTNFSYIGELYKESTDTTGADHTTNSTTPVVKRTFAFTGMETNFGVSRIEIEGINVKNADAGTDSYVGFEITDGSSTYTVGFDNEAYPVFYKVGQTTYNNVAISRVGNSYKAQDENYVFDVPPSLLTGSTSWTVKVYLWSASGTYTATLKWGFTVRLVMQMRMNSTGSVSQS